MNYLRECHDSQRLTILLVTHERALADRYAQRILTLADGRLVDDTRVETAAAQAQRGER